MNLNVEEMTFIYETLHERKASGNNSKKEERVCNKVMNHIEKLILKEEATDDQ